MRLVLYTPEIPQNVGTLMRLGACLNVGIDIIEPLGFVWDSPKLRRSVMDYLPYCDVKLYPDWEAYLRQKTGRLLALTPTGALPYWQHDFRPGDNLIIGRESDGIPLEIVNQSDNSLYIPMAEGRRSLNMAIAAAIVVGEGVRKISLLYS